jgi:hypothetical protein
MVSLHIFSSLINFIKTYWLLPHYHPIFLLEKNFLKFWVHLKVECTLNLKKCCVKENLRSELKRYLKKKISHTQTHMHAHAYICTSPFSPPQLHTLYMAHALHVEEVHVLHLLCSYCSCFLWHYQLHHFKWTVLTKFAIKAIFVLCDSQNVSVGSIAYAFDFVQTNEMGVSIVYYIMIIFSMLATRGGLSSTRGLGSTMTARGLGWTMTARGQSIGISNGCYRKHWLCLD